MRRSSCGSLITRRRLSTKRRSMIARRGDDAELMLQRFDDVRQREAADFRREFAGIQARDFEQCIEQILGRLERRVGAFGEARAFRIERLLAQRRGEQARGVERLQQIVRGGGEEARLARIRRFGFALGGFLRDQRFAQFARALRDALFEVFVRFAQRQFGALVVGDVAEGGEIAAAGQRSAARFDEASVGPFAHEHVRFAAAQMIQTPLNLLLDHAVAEQFAARRCGGSDRRAAGRRRRILPDSRTDRDSGGSTRRCTGSRRPR